MRPETWEDRNDAFYLERYREDQGLETLLAICFTDRGETFHHWKVFSSGSGGVCIEFDKDMLLKAFPSSEGFRYGKVEYRLISTVTKIRPKVETWPFLKRKAFKDESEFRIIYENKKDNKRFKHVKIDLHAINKVTLSPWVPESVADSVRELIYTFKGCKVISVKRSPLLDTSRWKKAIEPLV